MSSKNILNTINQQKNEIIETSAYIEVTNQTLKFGATVYQFRNITGFSLADVGKKRIIPLAVIFLGFLWAFFLFTTSSNENINSFWGSVVICLSISGIMINENQPERYGFLLELNSGSSRIFITNDVEGVKTIVYELYELMEKETDSIYKINIDQRHASIGVGYAEKMKAKNIGGSIYNNDD